MYQNVDQHLVQAFPVLRDAHERFTIYFQDSLPQHYALFSEVFCPFLETLLALPSSPIRDETLLLGFKFAESLLETGDHALCDLVWIEMAESLDGWWFSRAYDFIGPHLRAHAERYEEGWAEAMGSVPAPPDPDRIINDSWGVRAAAVELLRDDSIQLEQLTDLS